MSRRSKLKPVLHIAGPGAGKTYGMVQRIVDSLPDIEPHRFIAVITYTNAAVDSITQELMKVTTAPNNVFIGTNHAFYNRFILGPYGYLFDVVPMDCVFTDIDVTRIGRSATADNGEPKQRAVIRGRGIINKLVEQGVVPFGEIVSRSAKLVKGEKTVRNALANRLQAIFIDEFQDLDIPQYEIIDQIRKAGKTQIIAVGDPEQYISGFTYQQRNKSIPPYDRIPFFRIEKLATIETNNVNRRSSPEIVSFSNQFHGKVEQTADRTSTPYSAVCFLDTTVSSEMVSMTRTMVDPFDKHLRLNLGRKASLLVLANENRTVNDFATEFGLMYISNDCRQPASILRETLMLIPMLTEKSVRQWSEEKRIDRIELRKVGLRLMRAIQQQAVFSAQNLVRAHSQILEVEPINVVEHNGIERRLRVLHGLLTEAPTSQMVEWCSTIHKAKGLEADAVLVVAKTRKELQRWITTDAAERKATKADTCRIGYVGFTRACDILCIACLQNIDDTTRDKLASLGVQFRPERRPTYRQMKLEI